MPKAEYLKAQRTTPQKPLRNFSGTPLIAATAHAKCTPHNIAHDIQARNIAKCLYGSLFCMLGEAGLRPHMDKRIRAIRAPAYLVQFRSSSVVAVCCRSDSDRGDAVCRQHSDKARRFTCNAQTEGATLFNAIIKTVGQRTMSCSEVLV